MAATAYKPETRPLSDREVSFLNDMDAADTEELDLVRVARPNEVVFSEPVDGTKDGRFDSTFQAGIEQTTMVEIYDRKGFPVPMNMALARVRLKKRDPETGERIFYPRPPQAPPVPIIACLSVWHRCRKMFFSQQHQIEHFRHKHKGEFQATEEQRKRDSDERLVALQEAQVRQGEATLAILSRLAEGQPVTPREAQEVLEGAEPIDDLSDLGRDELKALADELGVVYTAKWVGITKPAWRGMIRARREQIAGN